MKWIQWALDNAWTVIIVATVLAQLWQSVTRKKSGADEAAPPEEQTFEDPELAERTRKIREEIQRKIAERARQYPTEQPRAPQPEADAPPPIIREVVITPQPEPARGPVFSGSPRAAEAERHAAILEEQAALAEKLRELEAKKAAAARRAEFEAATADHTAQARVRSRATVLGDLRSPEALRRAFILREVLGPPVALRR